MCGQCMSGNSDWPGEQDQAFIALKQRLTSSPILALPALSKDFVLVTNASKFSMGAVLEQTNIDENFF